MRNQFLISVLITFLVMACSVAREIIEVSAEIKPLITEDQLVFRFE